MVTGLFKEPPDATELSPSEREGLLQTWITTRADLNVAEEQNILDGANWARRRRGVEVIDFLSDDFSKTLHKQMFGDVWNWAGTYRSRETNLGIAPLQIPIATRTVFDDARYWLQHQIYERDEFAIRIHHRMVAIHPFPNGNGRHTRLMADLLVERLGGQSFTWGGGILRDVGQLRATYIAGLKAADGHDIGPLLAFARS